MKDFTYHNPVRMFCGEGRLPEVLEEIERHGSKVLIVLGGESFVRNGNYAPFIAALDRAGIEHLEMRGNRVPSLAAARRGIDLCRREHVDCVLDIGGGVCMDLAKTIAFGARQSRDIWEYLTQAAKPDTMDHLPMGTIPTFPSSGSDMDGSTQITDDETGRQAGLWGVYPDFTWLNPAYIDSLSASALAQGQITTFVQVSIAYLGLERSGVAEAMALSLMTSILDNLRRLMRSPGDREIRTELMVLSALNVSGLTTLGKEGDWSLYPLEGIAQNACGVDYRQAITVLFPYWLRQCYGGQQVFRDYFSRVFAVACDGKDDETILSEGLRAIFDLYREFSLPVSFREITDEPGDPRALRDAIRMVGEQRSMYTTFTPERIETMMREAIAGPAR